MGQVDGRVLPSRGSAWTTPRRRPGPFGPAKVLLPEGQKVLTIPSTDTVASGLERLADHRIDQIPVVDARNTVVGMFTWKSFGQRIGDLQAAGIDVMSLPVAQMNLERPIFVDPETYIDTEADWKEVDYVLVGTPDALLGILSITDIYGRLNDFAEAFVLVYEIEHEIRDLFRDIFTADELTAVMADLSDASGEPEALAAMALREIVEGESPPDVDPLVGKKIRYAVGQLGKATKQKAKYRTVRALEDFTFAQYGLVIFDPEHWPRFENVFQQRSEILQVDFNKVNELRNGLFHFRQSIGPRDTDRLRLFRDKLRYDRELLGRQPPQGSMAD